MITKMFSSIKTKTALIFLVLFITGCTTAKKPIEFDFERGFYRNGDFQRLNYVGINITRDEKVYPYSFGDFGNSSNSVDVILVNDLDEDNEIDILLKLTSCGANCSGIYQILYYDPDNNEYIGTDYLSRSEITPITDPNGTIFVTRNYPFMTIFSNPVSGIGPIQILKYQDHSFQDITKEYPQIVEEDTKYWVAWMNNTNIEFSAEYARLTGKQNYQEREIFNEENEASIRYLSLISYVADMCLIDKCEEGFEMINTYCAKEDSSNTECYKRIEEYLNIALGS